MQPGPSHANERDNEATMKVDDRAISAYQNTVNLGDRVPRAKGAAPADIARPTGSSTSPTESARVTISAEARQLAAGGAPGVDPAKVAALKEKIANGTLNVDSKVVAERMVDRTG
jgi:flagellar biosynthesis anti-sigma factor FlgM